MAADEPSFEEFFAAEYGKVVRTVVLIVRDRQLGEDVTQEAFARCFSRWSKVGRYDKPAAWVRRVAIREAVKVCRRRPVAYEIRDVPAEPSSGIRDAVRMLPTNQRAALVLHYFEDRPVEEIATILGCSASTAKVHLHRARRRLAELLKEPDDVAR